MSETTANEQLKQNNASNANSTPEVKKNDLKLHRSNHSSSSLLNNRTTPTLHTLQYNLNLNNNTQNNTAQETNINMNIAQTTPISSPNSPNQPINNISPNNNNPSTVTTTSNGYFSGYLMKWTNYIKGYQKRWFVLNNGLLSYFR